MSSHRRHDRSDALNTAAAAVIPGGVNSNIRLAGQRVFFERASGAWMWDVDGNDYIDYLLGQGPNLLGHAPPDVHERVTNAARKGMIFGAQHPLEVEAAEAICRAVDWIDQVRFGVSGTEAVQAALRLARACTDRPKFIRFAGHYHGWLDNMLAVFEQDQAIPASAGQIADHLAEGITLPWNDIDAVRELLEARADDVAAIITEPMMLNAGAILPADGFLEGLRALCDEHDVVLIFDEVITGFRVALGGGAQRFGVTPDLAVYGKAIAGGWPVSIVAGKAELMQRFGTGEVNHSGTFNGSVMAAAAVVASLDRLTDPAFYSAIESYGEQLMSLIESASNEHCLDLHVQGVGMAFHVSFGRDANIRDNNDLATIDTQRYGLLTEKLFDQGVFVARRGIWYVSAAHGARELEETEHRIELAFKAMTQVEA